MANIKIENGLIIPDKAAVEELLNQVKNQISKDARLATLLKSDPCNFLSGIGLNEDIRGELLKSTVLDEVAGDKVKVYEDYFCCMITCCDTCVFTCWITNW